MGQNELELAPVFQRIYCSPSTIHATGHFTSKKGKGIYGFMSRFTGIPIRSKPTLFKLDIIKQNDKEIWVRRFGEKTFSTETTNKNSLITEKAGLFKLTFELSPSANQSIHYYSTAFAISGIKIPKRLSIKVNAHCFQLTPESWTFNIVVNSSKGKLVIEYSGEASIINK